MHKIYILGIGPGHRDYLLKITEDIINEVDVLIGGKRALEMFTDLDKEKITISVNLKKIKEYLLQNYHKKSIAVLVSGDPGLYSMMNYLKKHIDNSLLEVIPGISSLQLAASRIKLNWHDMKIVSLHGNKNIDKVLEEIRNSKKVGLLTDQSFPPQRIAASILKAGINKKRAIVFENLSYPDERIISGNMDELTGYRFSNLAVMVICNEEMGA